MRARPTIYYAGLAGMPERQVRAVLDAVDDAAKERGSRWVDADDVARQLGKSMARTRARLRLLTIAGALEAEPHINFTHTGATPRKFRRVR